MRSFTFLFTFTAIFFGTIISAAPLGPCNGIEVTTHQGRDTSKTFTDIIETLVSNVAQPSNELGAKIAELSY
jgi:hypothetical protein